MHSRSRLLIEQDYDKIKDCKPWGIEASPFDANNYFVWTAKIQGEKGSIWEGGIFRVYIRFDEHYNSCPPTVCFHTIPFHPNVDPITGKPTIDFLDNWDKWRPDYDLVYILTAVQKLLSKAVTTNVANKDALDLMVNYPALYRQMVYQCIEASQKLEEDLQQKSNKFTDQRVSLCIGTNNCHEGVNFAKSNKKSKNVQKRIAFEDYIHTWRGIATSQPEDKNVGKNSPPVFYQTEDSLRKPSPNLNKQHDCSEKKRKIDNVNRMKHIYMQHTRTERANNISVNIPTTDRLDEQLDGDYKVDDLVAWADNLEIDSL